jgi:hypothetical protein
MRPAEPPGGALAIPHLLAPRLASKRGLPCVLSDPKAYGTLACLLAAAQLLLERVLALEASVAHGRALRSVWGEQQDIAALRGDVGRLACRLARLAHWLGPDEEEAEVGEQAEAGGGGSAEARRGGESVRVVSSDFFFCNRFFSVLEGEAVSARWAARSKRRNQSSRRSLVEGLTRMQGRVQGS